VDRSNVSWWWWQLSRRRRTVSVGPPLVLNASLQAVLLAPRPGEPYTTIDPQRTQLVAAPFDARRTELLGTNFDPRRTQLTIR
jgi:hypothetical protein